MKKLDTLSKNVFTYYEVRNEYVKIIIVDSKGKKLITHLTEKNIKDVLNDLWNEIKVTNKLKELV